MLDNVKVELDLKDFDELREGNNEVRQIKSLIANAINVEKKKDGEDIKGVNLSVDLGVIEKVVRKYYAFGKDNRDWIDEVLDEKDISVRFDNPLNINKQVLNFDEETHTAICPTCGILVDMDREIYCYKCGQKLER